MATTPPSAGPVTLSVIAPCFNEADNVPALAARTAAVFDRFALAGELILVDDGSEDATWERIEQCAAGEGRVRGVRHPSNRGIERAWRSGLAAARGELVCLIDADLQNRPEDIPALYEAYGGGQYDLVQAVRHPAVVGERSRLFTRGLNTLLNTAFRTKLRDNKSGFVLCSRHALGLILRHRFDYRYFQCFIGVAASRRGLRIREVDTAFDLRRAGQSFLPHRPVLVSLRVLWELAKFRVETLGRSPAPWRRAGGERSSVAAHPPGVMSQMDETSREGSAASLPSLEGVHP